MSELMWSELFNQPAITATHAHYANVIADSTRDLEPCKWTLLSLLSARAKAFVACAQIEQALRDAGFMQAIAPLSAIGYLCAGAAYSQQGQHRRAVAIYEQGLTTVPESDADYDKLTQCKAASELRLRNAKRVDVIGQLPCDVVVLHIVPRVLGGEPLDSEAPCPYLHVSRTWRDRFLQSDDGSHFRVRAPYHRPFGIGFSSAIARQCAPRVLEHGHDQLALFAPHITKLTLEKYTRADAPDLLQRIDLASLKQLHIPTMAIAKPSLMLDTLRALGRTLTYLHIQYIPGRLQLPFRLRDILKDGPHLTYLSCPQLEADLPSAPTHGYPCLTTLHLPDAFTHITSDKMMRLMAHLPSLEELVVYPCPDSASLILVQKHCPRLQRLKYGGGDHMHRGFPGDCAGGSSKGLRSLYLKDRSPNRVYLQQHLSSVMVQNCETLQVLELDVELSGCVPSHMQHLYQFTRLRKLKIRWLDDSEVHWYVWLIRNASNVETVELWTPHFIHGDVLDAIQELGHLHTLSIKFAQPSGEHEKAMQRLLDHHVRLGTHSTLRTLKVEIAESMHESSTWLYSIPKLTLLQSLNFSVRTRLHFPFVRYMRTLAQGCPSLQSLHLFCEKTIDDGLLFHLRSLKRLKRLSVYADQVSGEDLMSLLACRQLEYLELGVEMVNPDVFEFLEHAIPTVTYK